jgi:hypothetical protein
MLAGALRRMLGGRSRRCDLLVVLALAAVARPVAAGPARIVTPAGGETFDAGQVVEVRWEGLPADVDEMELLLDVDEHAAWRLRLTPQLAATSDGYLWRVPNLPGNRATLRLRWGRDGVETEGEPSAPFALRVDRDEPVEGLRFHAGEWWIADGEPTRLPPWRTVGRGFGLVVGHPQPAATSEGVESLLEAAPPELGRGDGRAAARGEPAPGRPHSTVRRPLTAPLRP